jgi:hypothetical protein
MIRVAMEWVEGHLDAVDSLVGTGSRAAHQAEVRTLVKPSREVLLTMTGDRRSQKHTQGHSPAKGAWRLRPLRREQLRNRSTRPNP